MPMDEPHLRRQSRSAYLLLASGVLIAGGAIALTVAGLGSVPMVLGAIPIGALFLYFGYRAYTASKRGEVLFDEGDESPYLLAGSQSFWVLLGIVMIDAAFGIVPNAEVSAWLLVVGVVSFYAFVAYYRYVPQGLLSRGGRPAQSEP